MKFFLSFTFAFMLISCKDNSSGNHKVILDDILIENRDSTIHPGEDIYNYINGRWIRNNPIPSEEVSWSIAHLVINENFQKLREICESAASASNLPDSSNMKKIGDYWAMAIDSQRCDQLGITPIQPYIHLIDSAKSQEKLIEVIAALSSIGACTLVGNYVSQDDKNSDRSALFLSRVDWDFQIEIITLIMTSARSISGMSIQNISHACWSLFIPILLNQARCLRQLWVLKPISPTLPENLKISEIPIKITMPWRLIS